MPHNSQIEQGEVKCTYADCELVFNNEKDMKNHKRYDPKHEYCHKCDYDASSWDDMLDHKVEAMTPFLVGDRRHDKHKKLKHLTCELCSEDFKTKEGRRDHRRQVCLNRYIFPI